MKAIPTIFLSLALFIGAGANAASTAGGAPAPSPSNPAAATDTTDEQAAKFHYSIDDCYWSGSFPFCDGSCPDGWYQRGSPHDSGDGYLCVSGYKVFCCPDEPIPGST